VERNIEVDDDALGFVAADELNPAKSRVLLQLALAHPGAGGTIQEIFQTH
jgi:L-asparaginase/Glu-tRNA(Gln) amidotransferase subunit D